MATTRKILLDGDTLSLEAIAEVAHRRAEVGLSGEARLRVERARAVVDRVAEGKTAVYGINTGFGTLAEVRIDKKDLRTLQRNLLLSHSAGVGDPLPLPEARALLLLRCNVLAKGYSGIRPVTLDLALAMLARDVVPVVPARGSVGASGDLSPLAHLALVLIGEGEAFYRGERLTGQEALARAGLVPVVLEAKEGLALVNGTQAMSAVGSLTLLRAESLSEMADVAGAMTLEGLLGSHRPFLAAIQKVRPHPGQEACATHLRALPPRARSWRAIGTAPRFRTPIHYAACRRYTAPRARESLSVGGFWQWR
jgi:histidine ammonia-lyase